MAFETTSKDGMNLFQLASARMEWLSARQKVVAENIANADTPEYKAKDISSFEDYLKDGGLDVRDAATSWDTSLDGNAVVLEEQTLLATEIEGSHRMASLLYRKSHDLISLAVSK